MDIPTLRTCHFEADENSMIILENIEMLVGVATYSFPPSGTWAFYFINRQPWANISFPSVPITP